MHSFQIHLIFSALSIWARLITNVHPPLLTPGKGCELLRLFSVWNISTCSGKKHYLYIQASIHDIVNGFGTFPALVLAAGSHLSRGRHFTGQAVRSNFKYLTWVFSVWERKRDRERLVFLLNDFKRQTQHLVWCLTLWWRGINKSVSHCFLFYMRFFFFFKWIYRVLCLTHIFSHGLSRRHPGNSSRQLESNLLTLVFVWLIQVLHHYNIF